MLLYALTILVSAFLLFQVQPVIAKIILPWFGGSAAVWTTCLLFFQMVLLLGYLYAHAVVRYLKPRVADVLHAGAAAAERAGPADLSRGSPGSRPAAKSPPLAILGLLALTVGLPVFPALHHRTAAPGLVRAPLQRRDALPPVCALQCRVDVRPDQLPGAVRAGLRHPPAGLHLVLGLWRLHPVCAVSRPSGPAPRSRRSRLDEETGPSNPACACTPSGSRCRPAPPCCCWPPPTTFRRTSPRFRSSGCCR